MKLLQPRYRVVTDVYNGYEVQIWRWWLPIWIQAGTNTHQTMEHAVWYAKAHAKKCLKYLGPLG